MQNDERVYSISKNAKWLVQNVHRIQQPDGRLVCGSYRLTTLLTYYYTIELFYHYSLPSAKATFLDVTAAIKMACSCLEPITSTQKAPPIRLNSTLYADYKQAVQRNLDTFLYFESNEAVKVESWHVNTRLPRQHL